MQPPSSQPNELLRPAHCPGCSHPGPGSSVTTRATTNSPETAEHRPRFPTEHTVQEVADTGGGWHGDGWHGDGWHGRRWHRRLAGQRAAALQLPCLVGGGRFSHRNANGRPATPWHCGAFLGRKRCKGDPPTGSAPGTKAPGDWSQVSGGCQPVTGTRDPLLPGGCGGITGSFSWQREAGEPCPSDARCLLWPLPHPTM